MYRWVKGRICINVQLINITIYNIMKSLMCSSCDFKATGMTEEEVMDKVWGHMQEAHKEEAEKTMEMPREDQDKMREEARKMIKDEEEMWSHKKHPLGVFFNLE